MRPTSAYPKLMNGGTYGAQEPVFTAQSNRPSSSYTTRSKALKSDSTAYHTWLRRSNEFNSNLRNHPRDYNSVQTFNLRSGCKVTKSASQLQVRIDPDEFFDPKPVPQIDAQIPVREMERLICNLQEQVKYLTVYLEEEKLHHAGTKKRAKVDVEKSKAEMEKLHNQEIERILENHMELVEELKKEHAQQIDDLEDDMKHQYKKLENEYKLLQASFKNYKTKISDEMNEKWEDRKREFEWEKQRAIENSMDSTKRTMEEKFNKERVAIRKEYKELTQQMLDDQRKELEDFMRKMSDGKSSIEELKAKADLAEKLESEIKETKTQLQEAKREIRRITLELDETRANLSVYENRFEEKVSAVEDKYRKRIDDLVNEVSDFRVMLIKKAETLYEERAAADELQKRWTEFAKSKLEERLFPKNDRSAFITIPDEHTVVREISDFGGSGDCISSPKKEAQSDRIPESSRTGTINQESSKLFSVPPKKNPKKRQDDDSRDKKDISVTKAGKDKIKATLPLSTVYLLDTANLPYVDQAPGSGRSDARDPIATSRPQSPDVIY